MPEALRRWKITASWRKEYNIDTILTKPLPEFRGVKESYPLYYHGLTKPVFPDGKGGLARHLVYIEAPAKCDMEKLSALGMESLKQFERFITEWVYTYLVPYECDKIFNVVDVEGFKLTELKGDRLVAARSEVSPLKTFYRFLVDPNASSSSQTCRTGSSSSSSSPL